MAQSLAQSFLRAMTKLMQKAIERLTALPEKDQDAVATFILNNVPTEKAQVNLFQENQDNTSEEKFEALTDQLANVFAASLPSNVPPLSDYAVSRAGIYEDHP